MLSVYNFFALASSFVPFSCFIWRENASFQDMSPKVVEVAIAPNSESFLMWDALIMYVNIIFFLTNIALHNAVTAEVFG